MVLDDMPNFIGYMAQDTRSFKRKNIIFAIGKLWGKKLITESEYVRIDNLGKKIEERMSQEEIEYPDEFCDLLMNCEIKDHVALPCTNTIMEKNVI